MCVGREVFAIHLRIRRLTSYIREKTLANANEKLFNPKKMSKAPSLTAPYNTDDNEHELNGPFY